MQRPRSNKNSNSLTKSTNKEAKTKTEVSQSGASPRVGLAVCDETGEELLLLAGPCCGQVLYNPCLHHRTLTPKGHPENTTHDKLLIWHENHTAHTYTRARARTRTHSEHERHQSILLKLTDNRDRENATFVKPPKHS